MPVIDVQNLVVDYGKGRKTHRALHGISFQVQPGECVGFIGANGAGKSTTMKSLLGFVFPTSGSARVFGEAAGTVASRRRLGYLPEVALYYPFMKARELLELYGGLQGLSRRDLKTRIPGLLAEVGLEGKGEQLLKNFSKGMQQRLGIAQAIIADPELLIFDELSSGLDPMGRHDLREVLLNLKRKGTTIFFSSHELSEVEALCDRVIIINRGQVITQAPVSELMQPLNRFRIVFQCQGSPSADVEALRPVREGDSYSLDLTSQADYASAIAALTRNGCNINHTESQVQSLEDYFIGLVKGAPEPVG